MPAPLGRFKPLLVTIVVYFAGLNATHAATIVGPPANHRVRDTVLRGSEVDQSELIVVPPQHLDPPGEPLRRYLADARPNWTFTIGAAAPGTFNILQYDAFALPGIGGAEFTVLYDDGLTVVHTDYNWIQIAHPHNWGRFGSTDFIDSKFANIPFYSNYTPDLLPTLNTPAPNANRGPSIWKNTGGNYPGQRIQNPAGGGVVPAGDLLFTDEPFLEWNLVPLPPDFSSITFQLYLVKFTWNGIVGRRSGGTVEILDGIRWGVRLDREPDGGFNVAEPSSATQLSAALCLVVGLVIARRLHIGMRRRGPQLAAA